MLSNLVMLLDSLIAVWVLCGLAYKAS